MTFNDEEMLHYLYQHAFRTPLTYESYKLINATDVIGFTEKNYTELDWKKVREHYPMLYNALPLMRLSHPGISVRFLLALLRKEIRVRDYQLLLSSAGPIKDLRSTRQLEADYVRSCLTPFPLLPGGCGFIMGWLQNEGVSGVYYGNTLVMLCGGYGCILY